MTNKDLNLVIDQHLFQAPELKGTSKEPVPDMTVAENSFDRNKLIKEAINNSNEDEAMIDTSFTSNNPTTTDSSASNNSRGDGVNDMAANQIKQTNDTPAWRSTMSFKTESHRKEHNHLRPLAAKKYSLFWLGGLFALAAILSLLFIWFSLYQQNFKLSATAIDSENLRLSKNAEAVNLQLTRMQQQIDGLTALFKQQQGLINSNAVDLKQEVANLALQVESFSLQPVVADAKTIDKNVINSNQPIKSERTLPTTKQHWYLNVGTFTSKKAAQQLQRQLLSLGHEAEVNTISFEDKPAYRVQLAGFKDREAAENVAGQVMKQTDLNGLWAWHD